jgi:hypothetical protein
MCLITIKITVIISGTNRCNDSSLLQLECGLKISLQVIVYVKKSRNPLSAVASKPVVPKMYHFLNFP